MTEIEQKEIIASNLKRLMDGTPQRKVASDLGVNPTTYNQWCIGKAIPSIVEALRAKGENNG